MSYKEREEKATFDDLNGPNAHPLAEEIGARVNRLIAGYLAGQQDRRITDPTPVEELRELLYEPLPRRGQPYQQVIEEYSERIAAHTTSSTSPGYFGLMNPTPALMGIYADALISAMNQNQGASHHSPSGSVVEETVIRWLGEATGYGSDCCGHLTSGGTVANLTGMKLALHRTAPEVRRQGLVSAGRRLAVYVSDQVHFSLDRAMDVLGLGMDALRKVPSSPDATADVDAMAEAIRKDREQGWEPMAVVGIVGTTTSGAVDPLPRLADLAKDEGAWFHVDAAYGGAVGLSSDYPDLLAGLDRADSVTVDAHKWFFVPFVAGGILHKDPGHELDAFQTSALYIPPTGGPGRPPTDYYQRGIAGTRRFNALKVWMTLKNVGADWYSSVVDRQIALARRAGEAIGGTSDWEIAISPTTAIVTFRYVPGDIHEGIAKGGETAREALVRREALQKWIAACVQAEGRFWVSAAPLPGGTGLRLNVISYLTDSRTIDAFVAGLPELGRRASEAVL